jgi:multiple sugar transport system permease protein
VKKDSIRSIKRKETLFAYICLLPALIGLVVFIIIPIIAGLIISFTEYTIFRPPAFVGLRNYVNIFVNDNFFYKSIGVSFYYAIGSVCFGIVFSLLLASLLNKRIPFRGLWRSLFYMPSVIPGMATAILWGWMYHLDFGLFNFILRSLGLPRFQWIHSEATVIPALWLMGLWTCGGTVIIFLAGLQNVPKVFYEAAEIDGAGSFQRFIHVTFPLMSPIIFYNFLLGMIGGLQVFTQAYALTGGGPNNASLFIVFLIWREGFGKNNFGYAGAISFVFFIIVGLITILIFRTQDKWVFYHGK